MSHRPEDVYPYVAIQDIMSGTACAFRAGDPVPADTVDELGLDGEQVIHREDYEELLSHVRADSARPATVLQRGDMPPHLRSEAPAESKPAPAKPTATKGKASE